MASKVVIDIIGNDKASSAASSVSSAFGKLATTLAGIATAGAAAFLVLGKQALDATAEWERLSLSMETLVARELRAADSTLTMADALQQAGGRTQELLEWIQKLAIQSPFDVEGVATAYRTALAYGFVSEEAQRLTQNMIDFAAGTGQTTAVMNQIALALGQVRAKGKLAGQEILQLVNAGVPVNAILEDMGFTLDDVSKGLVTADLFLEAFSRTMEEDFAGAAKRGTNSWSGLLNSLGDIKKIGLRTLFKDTFDVLQPLVAKFAEWLQGDGLKVLEGWSKELGNITQSIVDMFSTLSSGDFSFVDLTQAFEDWADSIDWNKVSNDIADGIASIDWAAAGEQVRLGAENIIDGFETILKETDWAALFQESSVAFLDFMAGLTNQGSWENVWNTWQSNFDQLIQIIDSKGGQMAVRASMVGIAIPQNIAMALTAGTGGILAVISSWLPQIESELDRVKKIFFNYFQAAVQQAIRALIGMQGSLINAITTLISLAMGAIKPIVISVSVPSLAQFQKMADIVAQGMALINAAMGGGSSKKGVKVGGSSVGAGLTPYADGGIATGPKSGYPAMLHGTEAIIPLDGGNVPVQLTGGGTGGMVVNLTYAPAFSTGDRSELLSNLVPMLDEWYRRRLSS